MLQQNANLASGMPVGEHLKDCEDEQSYLETKIHSKRTEDTATIENPQDFTAHNGKRGYDDELNKLLGPSEKKIKKTMNKKLRKKFK